MWLFQNYLNYEEIGLISDITLTFPIYFYNKLDNFKLIIFYRWLHSNYLNHGLIEIG